MRQGDRLESEVPPKVLIAFRRRAVLSEETGTCAALKLIEVADAGERKQNGGRRFRKDETRRNESIRDCVTCPLQAKYFPSPPSPPQIFFYQE